MPALQTSRRPQQYRPTDYASPRPHMMGGFAPPNASYDRWIIIHGVPQRCCRSVTSHTNRWTFSPPQTGGGCRANRRKSWSLEHDPEKWIPVFGKRSCSNNKLERDDDSKKSHPVLARLLGERADRRRRGEVVHLGAVGT